MATSTQVDVFDGTTTAPDTISHIALGFSTFALGLYFVIYQKHNIRNRIVTLWVMYLFTQPIFSINATLTSNYPWYPDKISAFIALITTGYNGAFTTFMALSILYATNKSSNILITLVKTTKRLILFTNLYAILFFIIIIAAMVFNAMEIGFTIGILLNLITPGFLIAFSLQKYHSLTRNKGSRLVFSSFCVALGTIAMTIGLFGGNYWNTNWQLTRFLMVLLFVAPTSAVILEMKNIVFGMEVKVEVYEEEELVPTDV
eukprot:551938_1